MVYSQTRYTSIFVKMISSEDTGLFGYIVYL